jgi:hypothetical protein
VNEFLPPQFVERIERLVLGIEPLDALRRSRIPHPLDLVIDGAPLLNGGAHRPREISWDAVFGLPDPIGRLAEVPRHNSCRHALLFKPGIKSPIAIRLFDWTRRFVPRRISYPIPADIHTVAPPSRVRRPALFPGAAYAISETVTGLRGRVTWNEPELNEVPARWVRVEARIDGQIVGRAHGDDRGEFLLILDGAAGGVGDLPAPLVAEVTVFGPAIRPPIPANDPFGDLPVEVLAGDPDDISPGEQIPLGYMANAHSGRPVIFELGRLLTDQPKFFFNP